MSEAIAQLFKDLRKWKSQLQNQIETSYQQERFHLSPATALSEEAVCSVDEQKLTEKLCGDQPLTLEEIFIVKQLFDPYLIEMRQRDQRIRNAITIALSAQYQQGIISQDRFNEELNALHEWYNCAKELYESDKH